MKALRKRIVSWPELVILGFVFAIWIAFYAKPVGFIIVPEYVASEDLLLASSMVLFYLIVARKMWLWFAVVVCSDQRGSTLVYSVARLSHRSRSARATSNPTMGGRAYLPSRTEM
jgi:hypothetical protein